MPLQFHHVFTGKGVWRGEIDGQAFVDDLSCGIPKAGKVRQARGQFAIAAD